MAEVKSLKERKGVLESEATVELRIIGLQVRALPGANSSKTNYLKPIFTPEFRPSSWRFLP